MVSISTNNSYVTNNCKRLIEAKANMTIIKQIISKNSKTEFLVSIPKWFHCYYISHTNKNVLHQLLHRIDELIN